MGDQDNTEDREETEVERNQELRLQLKAALHYAVGKMCDHEGQVLSMTFDRAFIATLTELSLHQLSSMAFDLDAFSRHSKRTVISHEDVLLCARRMPSLRNRLENMVEPSKKRRKKTKEDNIDPKTSLD